MADNQLEGQGLLENNESTGSDLSQNVPKVVLAWKNLSFSVGSGDSRKEILNNVSGFANPSEILSIMGPSGSGKTSLLSVLANRLLLESSFEVKGDIRANNVPVYDTNISHYLSFIPQEIALFEFMTPFEFLKFNLKLKTTLSKADSKKRVNQVLKQFHLKKVKHSLIGDSLVKGLSGGEKKRLSIASELLTYPSVLILDEPTSGLDSYIAKEVISILKEIKKLGVNIIFTIHQPSSEIFNMFDRLILIQEGAFVYQGKAADSIGFFKQIGYEVPQNINPPEFYMRMLKIEDRFCLTSLEQNTIKVLREHYKSHENEIWKDMDYEDSLFLNKNLKRPDSVINSISCLTWRELINFKRNPFMNTFKVLQMIAYIFLFDTTYFDLGYDTKGVVNRKGVLISYLFIFFFLANFTITMTVAYEKKIVMKEMREGLYNVNSYFLTKLFLEFFVMILSCALLMYSTYYVVNLNHSTPEKVINFTIIQMVMYTLGTVLGLFGGALATSPIVASIISGVFGTTLINFSGYLTDPETGPTYTIWLRYLNPKFYLRNAVLQNEFNGLEVDKDVLPKPKVMFDFEGELYSNMLIPFIHIGVIYILACLIYWHHVNKLKIRN